MLWPIWVCRYNLIDDDIAGYYGATIIMTHRSTGRFPSISHAFLSAALPRARAVGHILSGAVDAVTVL